MRTTRLSSTRSVSRRATRHDTYRRERVDGRPVLIESGPLDLHYPLRPAPRWCHFGYFALKMDHITWPNRGEPAQLIHPNAQQGVRPDSACVPSQAHRHCRRVPARGSKPLKGRTLRRSLVKMIRLWIELGGKALDVFPLTCFSALLKRIPTYTSSNHSIMALLLTHAR